MSSDETVSPTPQGRPPSGRTAGVLRTFASLGIPQYRVYFIAMFLYFGAMQMTVLARPWLAFELSADEAGQRSAFVLGITVASNNLPSLVLSPFAGALADRLSMRNILMVCGALLGAFAAFTAAGVAAGVLEWWHIAVIGVFQGTVMTFVTPTRRAIVSSLVDERHLLNAVSLHTVAQNVNRTGMPLVAGLLIAAFGAEWAYVLIAGLYAGAIVGLVGVPVSRGAGRRGQSMAGATGEGLRYAMRQPTIRNLLLIGLAGSVFGQPVQHLLPMFQDVLDIGPAGLGLLLTLMGAGSLVGSTTAASLGDFRRKGLLLIGFFTLLGGAIVAFSASSIFVLSLVLMLPVGFGHSGRTALHLATLQSYSDPAMRGRVMALNAMQGGLMPGAVLAITAAAGVVGPQWALGVSGAVILLYGFWELLGSKTIRGLR